MWCIKSDSEEVFEVRGEYVLLPIGAKTRGDVKPFRTDSEERAMAVWMCFGGDYGEFRLVKE